MSIHVGGPSKNSLPRLAFSQVADYTDATNPCKLDHQDLLTWRRRAEGKARQSVTEPPDFSRVHESCSDLSQQDLRGLVRSECTLREPIYDG